MRLSQHAQATNCTDPNNINIQSIIDLIDPNMHKTPPHQFKQYVIMEQILDDTDDDDLLM